MSTATPIDSYASANLRSDGPQAVRPAAAGNAQVAATASASARSADSSVNLTAGAMQLQQLEKNLTKIPEVDQQRVSQIRSAIANGSYAIDAKAIAAKLTRMNADLAGAQ